MSRWALVCLFFLVPLNVGLAQQEFDVNQKVSDWVVQPSTGRVFAAVHKGEEVIEYGANGREVRRFKVGRHPAELIIKKDRLVVACHATGSVHIISLRSNKVTKKVKLPGKGPYGCFCSKAKNNFVYVISNTGTSWWDGEIFQIDVISGKVLKSVRVQGWRQSHPIHVAMSPDGKSVVLDARGKTSPSGATLMAVNEKELKFKQLKNHHRSFGPILSGPNNRFWMLGDLLYDAGIEKEIRKFKGKTVAIHPNYNMVAALKDKNLYIQKLSDGEIIKIIPMEEKSSKPSRTGNTRRNSGGVRNLPWNFDPMVSFDMKRNRVVVGFDSKAYWYDLKKIHSDLKPLVLLNLPRSANAFVGSTLKIQASLQGAKPKSKVRIRLKNGPESVKVTGSVINFTPKVADVGTKDMEVELIDAKSKEVLDVATCSVTISHSGVDVGFQCNGFNISESGKYGVVWGIERTDGQQSPYSQSRNTKNELAVIDFKKGKIISQKTMKGKVVSAAISDKFVFFSVSNTRSLVRTNHQLANAKNLFLDRQMTYVKPFSEDFLFVIDGDKKRFYSSDPFGEIAKKDYSRVMKNPDYLVTKQNFHNESIYYSIPLIGPNIKTGPAARLSNSRFSPNWGRNLHGIAMTNAEGNELFRFDYEKVGLISKYHPCGIFIDKEESYNRKARSLEFVDLADGGVKHRVTVRPERKSSRSPHRNYDRKYALRETKESVFFLDNDLLLFFKKPVAKLNSLTIPTHFSSIGQAIYPVSNETKIPLKAKSSVTGLEFHLLVESPHIKINKQTGLVTVHSQALWDSFFKNASLSKLHNQTIINTRTEDGSERRFNLTKMESVFWKETGLKLPKTKLAVSLKLAVEVRDSEGGAERLKFDVMFLGDRQPVLDSIHKKASDQQEIMKKEAERRRKQLEKMRAQQEAARRKRLAESKAANSDLEKRVEKLETRLRRMEATLDSILRKLEKEQEKK